MARPIAVFQHTEVGAPGAIVPILEALGRQVVRVRIVDGEPVPRDPAAFAGLVFLGGGMSVHDPLPWIADELALIRSAVESGIPVAGHCLGSQLVALALGGAVAPNERPEIGWCEIASDASPEALDWWGPHAGRQMQAFQWHADTFTLPPAAVRIATGAHCGNQAAVVHGRHLLLQCHLEMTPELVKLSMARNGHQLARQNALNNPAVSDAADIGHDLAGRTAGMHGLLAQLYGRWEMGCD